MVRFTPTAQGCIQHPNLTSNLNNKTYLNCHMNVAGATLFYVSKNFLSYALKRNWFIRFHSTPFTAGNPRNLYVLQAFFAFFCNAAVQVRQLNWNILACFFLRNPLNFWDEKSGDFTSTTINTQIDAWWIYTKRYKGEQNTSIESLAGQSFILYSLKSNWYMFNSTVQNAHIRNQSDEDILIFLRSIPINPKTHP